MMDLFDVDWVGIAIPTHSIAEMIVRGTLMYLALFVILRFVMKRQAGSIGLADILVIVLVADAAQNAISKGYESVTEGIVLVLTIVFWDFLLDWIAYRFPALRWILQREALLLISNGRLQRRNMRQEALTEDELLGQLRKKGIDDPSAVRRAFLEADGELTVIPKRPPS
jgi:uncharacterized membrane protein YcaP (DUF421 family)